MLYDADLRRVLLPHLRASGGLVVEEAPLMRNWRADVLVYHAAEIHGYEIKSDRDTFARLFDRRSPEIRKIEPAPEYLSTVCGQAAGYSRVCDFCNLVTTAAWADMAMDLLPDWWGVWLADIAFIQPLRVAKQSPEISNRCRIQQLWKAEAIKAARNLGLQVKSTWPVGRIWDAFSDLPHIDVGREACAAMRSRQQLKQGATT